MLCALLAVFVFACAADTPNPTDEIGIESDTDLTSPEIALRLAMALKGTRPTLYELEKVENDAGYINQLVDDWLKAPEFGETLRDLHHEIWKIRSDLTFFPTVGDLDAMGAGIWEVNQDIYEAPLRLIQDIVVNDQPYTQILTADYLLASDYVATVWDVVEAPNAGVGEVSDGDSSWRRMRWSDGRPPAGILSSSALFARYPSNGQNFHRGRAQVVANALLCHDYFDREVPIDGSVDLSDPEAVSTAFVENPACASCHHTLDPLASYFWGHRGVLLLGQISTYPISWYTSGHEILWQKTTKQPTGFYGDLGGDLHTLGEKIAADPRFARCTVERFWAWFTQAPRSEMKFSTRETLIRTFVESGYSAKALIRGIVLDPDFHKAASGDGESAEEIRGYLKLRPDQVIRLFDSLLNFQWTAQLEEILPAGVLGKVDLLRSEVLGFRSLFGGIDGFYASTPVHTTSITASLVLEQMAGHAAARLVPAVLAGEEESELLSMIEKPWADEVELRDWLADLHFRLFAQRLKGDSEEISETYELLVKLKEISGNSERAWTGVLNAMLRDPRMIYY